MMKCIMSRLAGNIGNSLRELTLVAGVLAMATTAASARDLKLGAFVTLSGPGADLGQQMRYGIEAAVERMAGQIKVDGEPVNVEVKWYDDEGKGDVGLNVVSRALDVDKIDLAVGFNSTDIVSRAMREFQQHSVPFIISAAAGGIIPTKITSGKMSYVFDYSPIISDLIPHLVNAVVANRPPEKVALVFPNVDYGKEASKLIKKLLKEKAPDAEIVSEIYPSLGTTDFSSDLAQIKSVETDTIFTDVYGSSAPIFLTQYNELKVPALIAHLGTSVASESFIKKNAAHMEGMLVNIRWVPNDSAPISKVFDSAYRKKAGASPTPFAVQAFDSALIGLEAVKQAGSFDADAIRQKLEEGTFDVAYGSVNFTSLAEGHRNILETMPIAQIQEGKQVVVYPKQYEKAGEKFEPLPPFSWSK